MAYTKEQNDEMARRIEMKIVPFITTRPYAGRRGSPAIPEGTRLYAIAYQHSKGGFFTYSYQDRQNAKETIDGMKRHQTDNEFFYPWNVVYDVENTLHVAPKAKKHLTLS